MNGINFSRVEKQDVPRNTRMIYGKYAKLFDHLLDLGKNQTACVEVDSKKDGYYMTGTLRQIASKEGFDLGWSRSKDHRSFYYWLESRKPQSVRRSA
jgi:hypothetical protein